MKKIIASLLCLSAVAGISGCAEQTLETATVMSAEITESSSEETSASTSVEETTENSPEPEMFIYHSYFDEYEFFDVTSPDLVNGVWSDVISNTDEGENASPELSWEPVEGAEEYVIYMVDANSNGFIHWKSAGITETHLPRGWAQKFSEYNGPHVGHGYTHIYDIYVLALKAPTSRLQGAMNWVNPKLDEFMAAVDTDVDGNTGNIISVGKITGTYTDIRFRDGVEPEGPYTM